MSGSPAEARCVTDERVIPAEVKRRGLTRCFVYTGLSMVPTFYKGQLLYVRPTTHDTAVGDITAGDIVVFSYDVDSYAVHRVVAVTGAGLITRGDNNAVDDKAPVPPEHVIGRVEMVEAGERLRTLPGGRRALWRVRARGGLRRVERWLRRLFGVPYRVLYGSRWVHPSLQGFLFRHLRVGRFRTPAGPVFKVVHGKRVMARWRPGQERLQVERPYDLFVHPDDLLVMLRRVTSAGMARDARPV